MWPKLVFSLCWLYSLSAWSEGRVVEIAGLVQYQKISEKSRFLQLKKNQLTQSASLFKVDPLAFLTLELSDYTRITASSGAQFYILEEHEHFTILLKEGTIKVKALQRLKNQNTRKIVIKTHKARVETSLGEFIVAHMGIMDHTSVYGISGMTLFHSKDKFNKERPVEIYENEESQLTSLLERPARTNKITEKKRKILTDFFKPRKKTKN